MRTEVAPRAGVPDEAALNRLLRAVDWRFLLPDPAPARAVLAGDRALLDGLAAAGARPAGGSSGAGGGADLAAVTDPRAATLARCVAALAPDGTCVAQVTRPAPGAAALAARRMRAAGLGRPTPYWSWPGRGTPAVWLPLDCAGAVEWFLASRGRGGAAAAGRRAAWRVGHATGALAPQCLVASRAGVAGTPWLTRVLDGTGAAGPAAPSWMLVTGGRRAINKVVALGFRPQERAPFVAVKVARVPESEEALRREAANLEALTASPAAAQAPRLLRAPDGPGPVALAETFEAGAPLMDALDGATHRGHAIAVTDWLLGLAGGTRADPAGRWTRLVEAPLREFADLYRDVVTEADLAETRRRLAPLDALPDAFEQRDCSPWNILLAPGGGLRVLDWESAEPHGLAGLDLVYHLTFTGLAVERALDAGQEAAYRRVRDPRTPTGRIARECEDRYAAALGLPAAAMGPLWLLAWIVHARGEHARLVADAGGRAGRDELARGVFLRLWREELALGADAARGSDRPR